MALSPGDKAPEISLEDQNGKIQSSKNLKRNKLLLFFYPKDGTPGCTAEVCEFRDKFSKFKKLGLTVWGVSNDNRNSHERFAKEFSLPYPILQDKNNLLRKAFNIPNNFGILPRRVTFIIDENGIVLFVYENLLDGPSHVIKAIEFLEKANINE